MTHGTVRIQVQDLAGNWRTLAQTSAGEQQIYARMMELAKQRQYRDRRIRAIDRDGMILNIL